jgi:hypothetical protein
MNHYHQPKSFFINSRLYKKIKKLEACLKSISLTTTPSKISTSPIVQSFPAFLQSNFSRSPSDQPSHIPMGKKRPHDTSTSTFSPNKKPQTNIPFKNEPNTDSNVGSNVPIPPLPLATSTSPLVPPPAPLIAIVKDKMENTEVTCIYAQSIDSPTLNPLIWPNSELATSSTLPSSPQLITSIKPEAVTLRSGNTQYSSPPTASPTTFPSVITPMDIDASKLAAIYQFNKHEQLISKLEQTQSIQSKLMENISKHQLVSESIIASHASILIQNNQNLTTLSVLNNCKSGKLTSGKRSCACKMKK